MTWEPKHSRILDRRGDLVLCARLDHTGKRDTTLPPRWFTIQLKNDAPDWETVRYHRLLNEGERRLGLTKWRHPDTDG